MMCTSWQAFIQSGLIAAGLVGVGVAVMMYLDGYWTQERIRERWERSTFVGQDHAFRRRRGK